MSVYAWAPWASSTDSATLRPMANDPRERVARDVTVRDLFNRSSRPSFVCPRCLRQSWHPKDVEKGYCGNCHDWTGDPSAS